VEAKTKSTCQQFILADYQCFVSHKNACVDSKLKIKQAFFLANN
jgi:hypothetical protein